MSILQRATQTVAEAESSLRRMIGEAAESGDYPVVETLAVWASMLNELCKNEHRVESLAEQPIQQVTCKITTPTNAKATTASKAIGKRRSYPYFARSGDTIVKLAWSKSSKSEYQHKSPRTVAVRLADTLSRQSKNGAVVAMERVLPLKLDDGTPVPDYQVYVCLAWFRQIGAVKQNGRQGYSIKAPTELGKLIEAAWCELAEAKPA
jgi:hypothetical protein